MKRKTHRIYTVFLVLIATLIASCAKIEPKPKYIFLFIGDGMGNTHISTTQAFKASLQGDSVGFAPLSFTQFPYTGLSYTNCSNNRITESGAAGTALATGHKGNFLSVGLNEHDDIVYSIAVAAKESGKKVGILTNVSIDDATPAAFYAHSLHRKNYFEIAQWLSLSNFDLYASAGLLDPRDTYKKLTDAGYKIIRGTKEKLAGGKIFWEQDSLFDKKSLPFAIDRINNKEDLSNTMILKDMTEKSIEYLSKEEGTKNGFFLMVEGGMIDWASHDNNGAAMVHEVLDFSDAIQKAVDFYQKHPKETLIIVTADHETGGLSLGNKDMRYNTALETLANQKSSKQKKAEEINRKAGLNWGSTDHTAAAVPIFALGAYSQEFTGYLDNTQISAKLRLLIQQ